VERVEEWAQGIAPVPVREGEPRAGSVTVAGATAVRDLGRLDLDLVGILDADVALTRPGLDAPERALATWLEAASWTRREGRVIVQTHRPGDPAVQALVSGNPARLHRAESRRRSEAGFPPGCAVFRVGGSPGLGAELAALRPITLLETSSAGQSVCLVALPPTTIPAFSARMRVLAARGVVSRVEADPQYEGRRVHGRSADAGARRPDPA
jgi:hypothetical protein